MLSLIPLDENVELLINYELNTKRGKIVTRSPLSSTMRLAHAIRLAIGYVDTGAKVSIVARSTTYTDPSEFRKIWARRNFFQPLK